MLCFIWDTQHAVSFSQSLCMNASELRLILPWNKSLWEANTASEWHFLSQNAPQIQYLSMLRIYTNPSGHCVPTYLNTFSRVLILHGLMSISWDLHRREQTSLSLSIMESTVPWQIRMCSCYAAWKSDFEQYTTSVLSALSFTPAEQSKFRRFSVSNMGVYHTAQMILETDIIDLQIYAGARHIIGRPVTDADRARSCTRIEEWIARDEGKRAAKAAWHAARLFRDGVCKLENWNVDEMFHYPWCLYLATLACWTFHEAAKKGPPLSSSLPSASIPFAAARDRAMSDHASFSSSSSYAIDSNSSRHHTGPKNGDLDDDETDWDSRAEMNALISAFTRLDPARENFVKDMWAVGARHKTQGLLRCMIKQLNTVRWAVVKEGMVVLRGLLKVGSQAL